MPERNRLPRADVLSHFPVSEQAEPLAKKKKFDNQVSYQDWVLQSELALYPKTDKVSRYMGSLLDRLQSQEDRRSYNVRVYKGKPNAFCLPNGSIYVSDGLIDCVDSQEELFFALQHEKTHVTQEHAFKASQTGVFTTPGKIVSEALNHWGAERFHEWESDIRTFGNLEDLEINPMGGVTLFENVKRYSSQGKGRGMVHGSEVDRILNLRMMTRMQDITTVNDPFTPIPEEIRESLAGRRDVVSWHKRFSQSFAERDTKVIEQSLGQISEYGALLALPEVIDAYGTQSSSENAQRWASTQQEVGTILGQKVWQGIDDVFSGDDGPQLSTKQKTFVMYSLLELVSGSPASTDAKQTALFHPELTVLGQTSGEPLTWTKKKLGFQENLFSNEDVNQLLSVLQPEIFTRLGVKLNCKPQNLINNVVERVIAREMYYDYDQDGLDTASYMTFANRFSEVIANLYAVHGTEQVDSRVVFSSIITAAQSSLSAEDYELFKQEAITLRPDARELFHLEGQEQTPAERLVNLMQGYLVQRHEAEKNMRPSDYHDKRFAKITADINIAIDTQFKSALQQFFTDISFDTTDEALSFLASFRKQLLKNEPTWNLYANSVHFEENIFDVLLEQQFVQEMPSQVDRVLFATKVGLLLDRATNLRLNKSGAEASLYKASNQFKELIADPTFTLEDYEKFYTLLQKGGLDREIGTETNTVQVLDSPFSEISSTWESAFKQGIYIQLEKALMADPTKEAFGSLLAYLTTRFKFNHYGVGYRDTTGREDLQNNQLQKNNVLSGIFDRYQFRMENTRDLQTLHFLSTYFDNPSYTVRLQEVVWQKLIKHMSFEEGLTFLQQEIKARRLLSLDSAQMFIEAKAKTHNQIRQAKEVMVEFLSGGDTASDFGKLVVGEQLSDIFFGGDKPELLFAALGNGKDDSLLKKYLYKKWVAAFNINESMAVDLSLNAVMDHLYGLDTQTKYVLIRNLLTGEGGILTHKSPRHKAQLIDFFMDNYIDASSDAEREMQQSVRVILQEMVHTASYDLAYFALAPLLQKTIFTPPAKKAKWGGIIVGEQAPQFFASWGDSTQAIESKQQRNQEILSMITGKNNSALSKENETKRTRYEAVVQKILKRFEDTAKSAKMSPTEFVSDIGQTLGAPGVRGLQFLIQAMDQDVAESLNNVFDKVAGQSKITADATVLREWPDAENEIEELIEKIGGGSLMTVFTTLHTSGEKRVVKVLNQNALFHTETTSKLLTDVFTNLAQRDTRYLPALSILDDIKEWIRGDIDFTGFLEQDVAFRERYNGFSVGGDYQIKIPVTYPPENKYFVQEEFIEGTNLTELESLQAQGHDLRQIMSLVTKNFFEQLSQGVMHANLHQGNIRITADRQVALLDRNFYQSLTPEDTTFLAGLTQGMGDSSFVVNQCADYLALQGQDIDQETILRLHEKAAALNEIEDPTSKILGLTVMLRQEGLSFPLRVSLLVQNLFNIDRLNKKVGYSGILEALMA